MGERYKVVFTGELQGHIQAEEVIAHLVATFKLAEIQARTLVLDGNRHVVKKNLDEASAQRYRAALEKAGMVVHVEPMTPASMELSLTPKEQAPSAASTPEQSGSAPAFTAGYEFVRCPACGSMRVEDGVCRDCGVVREKYLARKGAETAQAAPPSEPAAPGSNPYEAPRADLRPEQRTGEMRGPESVPAGNGWTWITRGFWHFKTNPLAWILALIVLVAISVVMGLIPFAGGLVTTLLGAVFTGGLMLGAREQDQGEDFRVGHLFAGFRDSFAQLVLVGVLYLVGALLIGALVGGVLLGTMIPMMAGMDPAAFETQDPTALIATIGPVGLIALLAAALLFIPLIMAFIFAPALVMLDEVGAIEAMKLSFAGCLKNILPFLVYGIAAMVLLFLAVIPLGLGLLVVWPTLTAAIYVAYRDIYFKPES